MTAPMGNRFWEARSSHGRNPIFSVPEEVESACLEYFHWVDDNPLQESELVKFQGDAKSVSVSKMRAMTIDGLCNFLDIGVSTWDDYRKRDNFSEVCLRMEQIIRQQKFEGASADLLNASIIARDLGLADKKDHSSSDGTMTPKPAIDVSKLSESAMAELLNAADNSD